MWALSMVSPSLSACVVCVCGPFFLPHFVSYIKSPVFLPHLPYFSKFQIVLRTGVALLAHSVNTYRMFPPCFTLLHIREELQPCCSLPRRERSLNMKKVRPWMVLVGCMVVGMGVLQAGVRYSQHADHEVDLRRPNRIEIAEGGREANSLTTSSKATVGLRGTASSVGTSSPVDDEYNLGRIQDPISELVAEADMKQIHHGIYRVRAKLADGKGDLVFAFKTECRPAAKWHGQQGWSEVGVYVFTQMFYDEDRASLATAPPARGVIVRVSNALLAKIVHADRCGVLGEKEKHALHTLYPTVSFESSKGGDGVDTPAFLVGVALTWQPRHDDNALPTKTEFASKFLPKSAGKDDVARSDPSARERVDQISDVSVMDYLLSNEDREEKNWFFDKNMRYVMMDNGWAFAGRKYEGSVCSEEAQLLACPPILRHLDDQRCSNVVNCRFRRRTVEHLRRFLQRWSEDGGSEQWQSQMSKDPLVALFVAAYGDENQKKKQGKLVYNQGLARYVQGCPGVPGKSNLISLLAYGLTRRLQLLQSHVDQCIVQHGEPYVLG